MSQKPTSGPYLPRNRDEVTLDWLQGVVSGNARFAGDPIAQASFQSLGDGLGQLSQLIAASVQCESGKQLELVIKLQTDVPAMHDIGMRYGYYENEVNFYNELADQIPLRTPEIYLAEFDAEQERVLVIMESFKGWHSPDQISGASVDQITLATEQLAGLTAAFWDAPMLQRHPWLRNLKSPALASVPADYVGCMDTALSRYGAMLPDSAEMAMRAIGSRMGPLFDVLCQGHQALAHWDYRVENLFFGPNGEFAVIDWQLLMVTRPAFDLAYLLSTNMDVELRREHEHELMARYLSELARHGVRDYDRDDLENDFRLGLLGLTGIPVIGGAGGDEGNERSMLLYGTIGARAFQAVEDWDALAVLPG